MADRGIIFSAPMVRALLTGRKFQTRQLMPQQEALRRAYSPIVSECSIFNYAGEELISSAPYSSGDRLFPAMAIPSLNRNYCADLYGRIWSRARDGNNWNCLSSGISSGRYVTVTPAHDGKYRTRSVHNLIAEAYYGDQSEHYPHIRHLNGDESDNAPENIDWGTVEDNWSDRIAHGNAGGIDHHCAKLNPEKVAEIRSSDRPQRELARKYGVSQSTIWGARNGRFWVDDAKPNQPNFPRWASRLWLSVMDVRVQRLQDISVADALAEGCTRPPSNIESAGCYDHNIIAEYAGIWDGLHTKPGTRWADSPWVYALTWPEVNRGNIDAVS